MSLVDRVMRWYRYCMDGVWCDERNTLSVRIVKTLNLSVRSFMSTDLQMRASAMTYRTVLALVPMLALIFAIGRGFGFQNLIEHELMSFLPAQRDALSATFVFVDSYLAQSSEGLFVGVGIVFLLYTLISLLSDVENTFNSIWGVRQGRSMWRKVTDYTAICLILPILILCSSGITVFMSSTLQMLAPFRFMTPLITIALDFASLVLVWLFFTGAYILIPNTKVKFGNAFIAGVLAGSAFMILQWLFVSGTLYVTRYNAIYGSFAFLPLMLIWLQLVWVITLAGSVICYSSQNIVQFAFNNEITRISIDYRRRVLLAVSAVVARRFDENAKPPTTGMISASYKIPVTLVSNAVNTLIEAGIINRIDIDAKHGIYGLAPAYSIARMTVTDVLNAVDHVGTNDFIQTFRSEFKDVNALFDRMDAAFDDVGRDTLVSTLNVPPLIE